MDCVLTKFWTSVQAKEWSKAFGIEPWYRCSICGAWYSSPGSYRCGSSNTSRKD